MLQRLHFLLLPLLSLSANPPAETRIFKVSFSTPAFDSLDRKYKLLNLQAGTLLSIYSGGSKENIPEGLVRTNLGLVKEKALLDVSKDYEIITFSEPPHHCALDPSSDVYLCYNDSREDTSPVPNVTRLVLKRLKFFLISGYTCGDSTNRLLYGEDVRILPRYEMGIGNRTLTFFVKRGTKDVAFLEYRSDPWECS